jgi:hypothetical protein
MDTSTDHLLPSWPHSHLPRLWQPEALPRQHPLASPCTPSSRQTKPRAIQGQIRHIHSASSLSFPFLAIPHFNLFFGMHWPSRSSFIHRPVTGWRCSYLRTAFRKEKRRRKALQFCPSADRHNRSSLRSFVVKALEPDHDRDRRHSLVGAQIWPPDGARSGRGPRRASRAASNLRLGQASVTEA